LRHDQKDEDDLPKYEILDKILFCLIEQKMSKKEILQEGFDRSIVEKVIELLFKSEFKRQQAAPGPKVSKMLLGIDRRYPITNKFLKH
jgi:NH3-dependent NAD+ synthetase